MNNLVGIFIPTCPIISYYNFSLRNFDAAFWISGAPKIAEQTETPAAPAERILPLVSVVIPPIPTSGIGDWLHSSSNSSKVIKRQSALVPVKTNAPAPP